MNFQLQASYKQESVLIFSYHERTSLTHDNIDIFVKYRGITYSGVVYGYQNILDLLNKEDYPMYFYDKHGVVLKDLSDHSIIQAVMQLIENDEIGFIFAISED